jgi:Ran GTPase-activating protein (RanGAP) involved in mRNA processing and transport
VGSNDITFEGAAKLFKSLETHMTLSSLTLANHDRLHRNRMGFKACEALNELLKKNKILTMINISDNAISNEGLKIIANGALTLESNLVSINMSNNDLQGAIAIQSFSEIISLSKSLLELNLNDNGIGDSGIDEFTKLFT